MTCLCGRTWSSKVELSRCLTGHFIPASEIDILYSWLLGVKCRGESRGEGLLVRCLCGVAFVLETQPDFERFADHFLADSDSHVQYFLNSKLA